MTEEIAGSLVDLPEDWFQRAQRALADLQFKTEKQRRELAVREGEIEMRARDLSARGEQLREAFRKAEETSQTLMARTHALREEERKLAAEREALSAEREGAAKAREGLESRQAEIARREALLGSLDRQLKDREESLRTLESRIQSLRRQHGEQLGAAKSAAGPAIPVSVAAETRDDVVRELLQLKETLEAAAATAHLREDEADRRLRDAAARAQQAELLEGKIRDQETHLDALRAEVVNAKRALLSVDEALARMPYEVVDDFTKTEEFVSYEKAVRALRRFEDPTAGDAP